MNTRPLPPVLSRSGAGAVPPSSRAPAAVFGEEPRPFDFSHALDEARRSAPPPAPNREPAGNPIVALASPVPPAPVPAPNPALLMREEDNAARREQLGTRTLEGRDGSEARGESAWDREPQGPRQTDRPSATTTSTAPAPAADARSPAPAAAPSAAPTAGPAAPRPSRPAGSGTDAAGATREGAAQHRAARKAAAGADSGDARAQAAGRKRAGGGEDTASTDASTGLAAGPGAPAGDASTELQRALGHPALATDAAAPRGTPAPGADATTATAASAAAETTAAASSPLESMAQSGSESAASRAHLPARAQGLAATDARGAGAVAEQATDAASTPREARLQTALAATGGDAAGRAAASLPPLSLPSGYATGVATASLQAGAAPSVSASEATLQAQPGSDAFAHELGTQLSVFVREGVQHARLQLNPQDMGPVFVRIHLDGQAAQVHMAAEQGATRQALEQALPALAGQLSEAGITLTGGGVFERPSGGFGAEGRTPGNDESARGDAATSGPKGMADGAATIDGAALPAVGQWSRARGIVDLIA